MHAHAARQLAPPRTAVLSIGWQPADAASRKALLHIAARQRHAGVSAHRLTRHACEALPIRRACKHSCRLLQLCIANAAGGNGFGVGRRGTDGARTCMEAYSCRRCCSGGTDGPCCPARTRPPQGRLPNVPTCQPCKESNELVEVGSDGCISVINDLALLLLLLGRQLACKRDKRPALAQKAALDGSQDSVNPVL